MIFGHIDNIDARFLPGPFARAIDYLRLTDFSRLPAGRFTEPATGYIVQILDLTTQPREQLRPEVHRRNIDLQYLVSGQELIGVVTDNGHNVIAQELLEQRDIIFYQAVAHETMLTMIPGSFAIFLPEDVHRPACIDRRASAIRKVVVKIPVALFN